MDGQWCHPGALPRVDPKELHLRLRRRSRPVVRRAAEVRVKPHLHPDSEGDGAPSRRGDPARRRAVPGQRPVGQPGRHVDDRARRARLPWAAGLPDEFRFHDLRHYFASLPIASGLDVKVVRARPRLASAKTTLDTYGHLWPDRDDTSRAAVAAVYKERMRHRTGMYRVECGSTSTSATVAGTCLPTR